MQVRSMKVTLVVEVSDLPDQQRVELAEMVAIDESKLPRLSDYSVDEMAEPIESIIANQEELFAGSEIYARYRDVRVESAQWTSEVRHDRPDE